MQEWKAAESPKAVFGELDEHILDVDVLEALRSEPAADREVWFQVLFEIETKKRRLKLVLEATRDSIEKDEWRACYVK